MSLPALLAVLLASEPPARAASEKILLPLRSGRVLSATLQLAPTLFQNRSSPLSVLLVFGGFQKAAEVGAVVRQTGLADAFAIASFDYPFDPPRRVIFPESLFWIPKLHQMVHETIEGIGLLADVLSKDPRVDPRRIVALGASLGAPMVLAAASHGAKVSHLVLVHGFADLPQVIAWQFERPWRERWGVFSSFSGPFSRVLAEILLWRSGIEDPGLQALRLPDSLPVLSVRAANDAFVPKSCSDQLESALRNSRARVTLEATEGGHLQPGSATTLKDVGARIKVWLSGMGFARAWRSDRG